MLDPADNWHADQTDTVVPRLQIKLKLRSPSQAINESTEYEIKATRISGWDRQRRHCSCNHLLKVNFASVTQPLISD